jgi:hypothetical protein
VSSRRLPATGLHARPTTPTWHPGLDTSLPQQQQQHKWTQQHMQSQMLVLLQPLCSMALLHMQLPVQLVVWKAAGVVQS